MYRLSVPNRKTDVINLLDTLFNEKHLELKDVKTTRMLGMYISPWRDNGILSLFVENKQKRTRIEVNVLNVEKLIRPGKRVEYVVNDLNIKLPRF